MIEDIFKQNFKRRSFILGTAKGALFGGLLMRLVHLQIFNREHYQILADKNRIVERMIDSPRGQIIDDKGKFLAINQNIYRCLLSPDIQNYTDQDILEISKIINLSPDYTKEILKKNTKKGAIPFVLKENLNWEEMAALNLKMFDIPAISIEKSQDRKYLHPKALCHLVGYISYASEKDFKEYNLSPIPGLKIGKSGIEKNFQNFLEGKPGKQRVEVNAKRRIVRILDNSPLEPGKDLKTTINLDLQLKISEILQEHKRAAAVVIETETGAVKAMVSQPGYDSNLFVPGISKTDWNELLNNEDRPLSNKVISGQYAPGSTFKMIIAFAALKEGIINSKTEFFCPGHYDLGNHRFHCWTWKTGGHGSVNLSAAIARSCDTYFYHLALQLGSLKMVEMAQKFLLGQPTGIELTGEKKGLIPSKEWAKVRKNFFSQKGNALNISIGQGVILTTPLQLARMTALIANNGKIIKPHLTSNSNEKYEFIEGIEPEWYEWVREGMFNCVNDWSGTGGLARLPNYLVAGKTGSSQVSRITMQQRQDGTYKDLPYNLKDHASFVGFAPFEQPKYAVSITVEHGGGGGAVAAPIGAKVLSAAHECCG